MQLKWRPFRFDYNVLRKNTNMLSSQSTIIYVCWYILTLCEYNQDTHHWSNINYMWGSAAHDLRPLYVDVSISVSTCEYCIHVQLHHLSVMASKIIRNSAVLQQHVRANKETTWKLRITEYLCWGSTDNRWIPLPKRLVTWKNTREKRTSPFHNPRNIFQLIVVWWRHMVTEIYVTNGLDNDLLPEGTKPLPERKLTSWLSINRVIWHSPSNFHWWISVDILCSNYLYMGFVRDVVCQILMPNG